MRVGDVRVDWVLQRVVGDEGASVPREMVWKTLRAMQGDLDEEGGEDCGGSIVSDGLISFRRRRRELGALSCGNSATPTSSELHAVFSDDRFLSVVLDLCKLLCF